MLDPTTLISFGLAATALIVMPGPATLYIVTRSLDPQPLSRVFYQGMVVNVLNPKAAIFFLAFLPQFINPSAGPVWQQLIPLCCVFVCIGLASDSTYALIAGKMRQWLFRHASFLRRQKYVVGGTYIALGMAAATVSPARK